MGYFDGIKECEDLVSFALESVTEPTTIYDQSPCNSGTLRFVAIKFDEHNFGFLFFIPVLVVYPYQTPAEGEYFAKGDEDRVVDLCQWRSHKSCHQHCASKDAQCHSKDKLKLLHNSKFKILNSKLL